MGEYNPNKDLRQVSYNTYIDLAVARGNGNNSTIETYVTASSNSFGNTEHEQIVKERAEFWKVLGVTSEKLVESGEISDGSIEERVYSTLLEAGKTRGMIYDQAGLNYGEFRTYLDYSSSRLYESIREAFGLAKDKGARSNSDAIEAFKTIAKNVRTGREIYGASLSDSSRKVFYDLANASDEFIEKTYASLGIETNKSRLPGKKLGYRETGEWLDWDATIRRNNTLEVTRRVEQVVNRRILERRPLTNPPRKKGFFNRLGQTAIKAGKIAAIGLIAAGAFGVVYQGLNRVLGSVGGFRGSLSSVNPVDK